MKTVLSFILLTFFTALPEYAEMDSSAQTFTLESLSAEIEQSGPKVVIKNLYSDFQAWDKLMGNIASGETEWLSIAVLLYPGSDAGTTSMLRQSVGLALVNNPTGVLRTAVPTYGIRFVCSGRADPLPTYEQALTELETQINSVKAIQDPQLIELRDKCLANLNNAKPSLRRFFGVN